MGYIVDELDCIDENECVSNNGHGPCQDTCTNLEGSFTCGCEGLPGTVLAADGKSCEEIDICKENNGGCSHECLTSYGQSFCTCPTGMKLDVDWKTCVDQSGNSVLTTDVQKTSCESGFILDTLTNECVDDNECDKNPCGDNGYCVNEQPGYRCDCFKGYEFDATTCIDKNECLENSCANGICINTDGNYQCKCYEGYELDVYGMNCVDINECVEENICGSGTCVNLDGGFDCDCPQGYQKSEGGECVDINECKEKHKCGKGAHCVNIEGSYECKCKTPGKEYDEKVKKCKRVQCPKNHCTKNGKCVSDGSGFKCICKPGYAGSRCDQDIDECEPNNPCQHKCENTKGSFKCHCHAGFIKNESDHTKCIDLDECSNIKCENGHCINTNGSYKCECKDGYRYDAMADKCIMEPKACKEQCSHACGPEGVCICPKGYVLDPQNQVECIKKKKRRKKTKVQGCPPFNETTGIKVTYSKDIDTLTNLYPRSTSIKGKCEGGYKASGKLRKKCKKDGSWMGSDLTCTLITCPAIIDLEPGMYSTCVPKSFCTNNKNNFFSFFFKV